MSNRESVDFTKSKDEVIDQLAEGDPLARIVLCHVLATSEPMNAFIDMADMNLRGPQIVEALAYCQNDLHGFINALLERDKGLVEYVNAHLPHLPPARQHGEQRRISQIDFAMQSALEAQQMDSKIQRMDEGSDHVHNFFLTVARQMQASKKFTINMRINTGLEQAYTLVFAIALADVLDINGKSAKDSPVKEDERILQVQEEIAAERRDPLPPEVQKAIDEGRW